MGWGNRLKVSLACAFVCFLPSASSEQELSSPVTAPSSGQTTDSQSSPHEHTNMSMDMGGGWQWMQDGDFYAVLNQQGGPRGENEVTAPNWWMGMATRKIGASQLTLNGMFSLDPATVGKSGYSEIFQVGEELNGVPLIDRQHPHDLFMQLAAAWRTPLTATTGLTLAGGPVGEPALGPVAYMHRPSVAYYPFAPLSHHIFDSTHVSFGVVTAAVDHGPWIAEASVFNGREPDDDRWDIDLASLNSVSGRVWYRPSKNWEVQVSTGHLTNPEQLEPGNLQRTTASASWLTQTGTDFDAITVGYGWNASNDDNRHGAFFEGTRHVGKNAVFGRVEVLQVPTNLLLTDQVPTTEAEAAQTSTLGALTLGGARDLVNWHGFEGSLGAAVAFYAVPNSLRPAYSSHPVSFQVYLLVRPPLSKMGRMWNRRMTQVMSGHAM